MSSLPPKVMPKRHRRERNYLLFTRMSKGIFFSEMGGDARDTACPVHVSGRITGAT
jgi:hypothetical protein